jgi:DNA-binding transcriptional ArsR family regulator
MLYALMDDRARTSTELALIARVTASTASAHLQRLKAEGLVDVVAQGKHRYYRLGGPEVAGVLEAMSVLNGGRSEPVSPAPPRLRAARTCYDHLAGALGVALHDGLIALGWMARYELTPKGEAGLRKIGADVDVARAARRRFAFGCLDWSERRPHLGGALGATLLALALRKRWVVRHESDRALGITQLGRRALLTHFAVRLKLAD